MFPLHTLCDDGEADDTEGDDPAGWPRSGWRNKVAMTSEAGWQSTIDDDLQSMTNEFDDRFAERHHEVSSTKWSSFEEGHHT